MEKNRHKPIQVAMQDLADFIMKQPKRRKLAMCDNTSAKSKCGLGCVMVQYGIDELGISRDFSCTNATWYPSSFLPNSITGRCASSDIAEIKDGHVWNLCYNGEHDEWPYGAQSVDEATTYGELQNNISDEYE